MKFIAYFYVCLGGQKYLPKHNLLDTLNSQQCIDGTEENV